MMSSSDEQSARALFKASQKTPNVAEYVLDVKVKTWVDNDWASMLAVAPVCLELLGSCCLVASTSVAQTTELSKPDKGFNKLKGYKYLAPTLVEVVNRGDTAFRVAREKMADISERCGAVKGNVREIFRELKEPEFDSGSVKVEMEVLLEASQKCQADAVTMHSEFVEWLEFVKELHEACVNESSSNEVKFNTVSAQENSKKLEEAERKKYYDEYQEKVNKVEAKLADYETKYKDLLDKWPTGDDLLKQQLMVMAAEAISSLVKTLGKAVAAKLSPMSVFSKDDDKSTTGASGGSKKKKSRPAIDDADEEDMALANCPLVLRALMGLQEIVGGKNGVDWDLVVSSATGKKSGPKEKDQKNSKKAKSGKLNLGIVSNLLTDTRSSIRKDPDERSTKAGKALLQILKDAIAVADAVEKAGANKTKTFDLPKKDSSTVKGWGKTVDGLLTKTRKLRSQASASGSSPSPTPIVAPVEDEQDELAGKMDINTATIEAARVAVETAQKTMLSTQEVARQMGDKALELQDKLANLRREIHELGQKKITLEVVRGVLQDCIRFLIQLEDNMKKLILFFSTVAKMISVAVDTRVKPFTKHVENAGNTRDKGKMYTEHVLMRIFQYALNVAAHFDLYKDISTMYCKVHDADIARGIVVVKRMSILSTDKGTESLLAQKKLELSEYAEGAQQSIRAIVKAQGDAYAAGYTIRIQAFSQLLGSITVPALPAEQKKAIKEGAEEGAQMLKDRLQFSNGALDSLTQPREVRNQHAKELVHATDPDYRAEMEAERKRQKEEKRRKAQEEHDDY
ncbi:hypothetical protein BBP40_004341 [Aspergillus hancockii]|nr:hypothetical protein BBP40_004341 [Aspergillus hancockii]